MPVPVWDCPELGPMEEALDTASVVSEDIWKKFDLDFPLDIYSDRSYDENVLPELCYDKVTCLESREIRHHDCMWAGLCISKEHNRTLPAKKESQPQKKIPAGRSLLISRAGTSNRSLINNIQQHHEKQQQQQQSIEQQCRTKSLESDGDSTRPDTPPTSTSDTETEDEAPVFRHEQININEKLSECLSEPIRAAPAREVTGQFIRRFYDRRKEDENNQQQQHQPSVRNTLSDHSYHLNQAACKRLDNLGIQTPSESEEEEIDVVTFEKPCRQTSLSNGDFNQLQQQQQQHQSQHHHHHHHQHQHHPQHHQLHHQQQQLHRQQQQQQQQQLNNPRNSSKEKKIAAPAPATAAATVPRPRGRPPSNPAARKRNAPQSNNAEKPVKRTCQRTYQKRNKTRRGNGSKSSSEDELDTEKRSLHNNMERQRRVELRHYFEDLRRLVPAVEPKEKAAKVTILRQAALYCDTLSRMNLSNKAEISELSRRQDMLRARLRYLRRSLALSR